MAWVDKVVGKRGTTEVAKAYLEFLFTPEGQEIAAKNFYRPRLEAVALKYAGTFPKVSLFTIDEVFGGWQKAQQTAGAPVNLTWNRFGVSSPKLQRCADCGKQSRQPVLRLTRDLPARHRWRAKRLLTNEKNS